MRTVRRRNQIETLVKYGHGIKVIFNKLKTTPEGPWNLRRDGNGKWIDFYDYGDHTAPTGWDVDHIRPKTIYTELEFDLSNLRALNWRDNIAKSNKFDYLDKTNHYEVLKHNPVIRQHHRKTKIRAGRQYNVYLNAKEQVTRICRVLEVDKGGHKVWVEHDRAKYWVYHDPILFVNMV